MKTLLNSEYLFSNEGVNLTLYINYDNKTFDIQEPGQEGVFYGVCADTTEGMIKAQLLLNVMTFVYDEFKEINDFPDPE